MTNKYENLQDWPAEKNTDILTSRDDRASRNYPFSVILPDYITFNAWPMFFLERSLFWYRLIGAIPPRGDKRIKDQGGNVFPQNEEKKVQYQYTRDLGTHLRPRIFPVKDALLEYYKKREMFYIWFYFFLAETKIQLRPQQPTSAQLIQLWFSES